MERLLSTPRIAGDAWGAWDRFLVGHPDSGYHQSSWWATAHRKDDEDAFGVVVRQDGIVHGGAVVTREPWDRRHARYRLVDGPVLPTDPAIAEEVLFALLTTIQHRRAHEPAVISHLRVEPRWHHLPEYFRGLGSLVVGPPRTRTTIDLGTSETSLLAEMAPAVRSNIALARQLHIRITEDTTPSGVQDLLAIAELAGGAGTGTDSPDALRLLPLLGAPGRGGIFFAEDGGTRLAGAATVHFGRRATLLVAASATATPDAPAAALLQFEVMRRAKHRHCVEYDLGRLSAQGPLFKGLGGRTGGVVGSVDIVLDPAAHAEYLARARSLALDVSPLLELDVI